MNTKLLKQKILDLAIRGKLVPQDPNDEPASVLLERIRAEKERLMAEGKIKRSKSTSDNRHYENVPFEIPDSWEWLTGKDVFQPMETTSPQGEFFDYIDIDAIDNTHNVVSSPKHLLSEYAPSRATRRVIKGDVLFSMVRPYLRNIAKVEVDDCIASSGFFVCRSNGIITCDYCFYMMICDYIVNGLNQFMKGDNSPSINNDNILSWLYPIPPLAEQQRIVLEIERWFKLIDIIEDGKSDLQDIILKAKAKVLDLAIHGKLVPQDPNDEPAKEMLRRIAPNVRICDTSHYGNLPSSWCVCTLKDVFDITMGSSPIGSSLNTQQNGIEFHQGKTFFSDLLLEKSDVYTNSPTKLADANSVLLCVRAPVGIVNLTNRTICIGRGLCALKPKREIDLLFAFYSMQTHKNHFDEQSTGTTFKAISSDIIREETFVLPPYREQIRIREKVENILYQLNTIITEL